MVAGKRGMSLEKVVVHIILIGILFIVFLMAMDAKIGSRGVKQQVLEKQLALLIDAADEGFRFEVMRGNKNGLVDDLDIRDGRVFVSVDGFASGDGYPYFSEHDVDVDVEDIKFVVRVG